MSLPIFHVTMHGVRSAGGLFANTEVEWGCMSKTVGILAIFALVPVTAALGIKAHLMILARYPRISTKRMLLIALYMCTVIPLYALVGLFTTNLGVQQGWEIILVAVWYGFCLGPVIAHARSLFALLIPRGKESAFYSMFELTNRGSSAAGPAIIALIQQLTGNLRFGFIFVLLSILLPAILLEFVDIQAGAQAAKAASHTPPVSLVKPLPAAGTPRSKPAAGPAAVASCASVELTAINPAHSFIHREPRAAPTVTSA
ncbi:hypothetical protein EON66_05860 [archaeon]|nr:MAG: hypothetical protein EON66_05860 [archaeon]